MAKILKDEIIEKVSADNQLQASVADALKINVGSMPKVLERKSRRLTEFAVLKVIADFLHVKMDELLIEDSKVSA